MRDRDGRGGIVYRAGNGDRQPIRQTDYDGDNNDLRYVTAMWTATDE
jgi:hypothetical protein